MIDLIQCIPKAELHIHIEGSLEPELMFRLARKHHISLPYHSIDEIRQAYHFNDLQSFLDLYYQGSRVLIDEDDFYMLTCNYLQKAAAQNVRHVEIFFDPQAHTRRGIKFETVVRGINRALSECGQRLGLSYALIMCFLRDRPVSEAMETLEQALEFRNLITGVGLDSAERGYPSALFAPVFERARKHGFKAVAHAGEEGPPEYIWQAVEVLKVKRIDHGVRCMEDHKLVQHLARHQIPLTVCPLSNVKLRVFRSLDQHNILQMVKAGLCTTVNSDDPSYFGGYIVENFMALQQTFNLDSRDIYHFCRNGFIASFLDTTQKNKYLEELGQFVADHGLA
jgi:adenosine deaminase